MKFNGYQKLAVTTVIATIVLIFVGGLVRAAGAGLGCPDWPTCFGMWIPPTTAEALPPEFDAGLFNPLHTWIEYVNRLVGVVIGLLITATFAFSFAYRKSDPVITISSGAAFVLVLFQGWLGGQVVQSGLSTGIITLHMILAMIIVNVLLFTAFRVAGKGGVQDITLSATARRRMMTAGILLLVLTLIQMILGTQVREMVDIVKNVPEPPPREIWLEHLSGWIYPLHRSFSWIIILVTGLLIKLNRSSDANPVLRNMGYGIGLAVLLQIIFGLGLEWWGMPGLFQVLHLVGIAILICLIFLYILIVGYARKKPDGSL